MKRPHRIRQPLDEALGLSLLLATEDRMEADLPLTGLAVNSVGRAHGGALVSAADALMANLAGPPADDRGAQRVVTVDLQAHFLRAARGESLRLVAQLLRKGRRLSFAECRIFDREGVLVAHVSGSYAALDDGLPQEL